MQTSVMSGGSWRTPTNLSGILDGTWQSVAAMWVFTSGAWRQVYAAALTAPNSLSATDTSFCSGGSPVYRATLNWTNGSAFLQVKVYDGNTLLATLPAGSTTFDDTTVSLGSFRNYRVAHYNGSIDSPSSNVAQLNISTNPC